MRLELATLRDAARFRRSDPLGESPAFSPGGALVAWVASRSARSTTTREHVCVSQLDSCETVCVIEGSRTVRALRFLDDAHLLVLRDHAEGCTVARYELPYGERVAERVLRATRERRPELTVSPDGRTVLVHGPWASFVTPSPLYALDARTLDLAWELDFATTALDAGDTLVRLHPDGASALIVGSRRPVAGKPRWSTPRPLRLGFGPPFRPLVETEGAEPLLLDACWLGPDALLLAHGEPAGNVDTPPVRAQLERVDLRGTRAQLDLAVAHPIHLLRASPDGSRLLVLANTRRSYEEPALPPPSQWRVRRDRSLARSFRSAAVDTQRAALSIARIDGDRLVVEYTGLHRHDGLYGARYASRTVAFRPDGDALALVEGGESVQVLTRASDRWEPARFDLPRGTGELFDTVEFLGSTQLALRGGAVTWLLSLADA